jgi:xanthine dehydrogenase YagR molybdenum-binding subunit
MTATPLGAPVRRIDGNAKVTGSARYASDEQVNNPAFAYLVTSSISRGSIQSFQLDAAHAVAGVIEILTHENIGKDFKKATGPDGGPTTETLESNQVWHDGQIIAIVLADTFEAAREAANKVQVAYQEDAPQCLVRLTWRRGRGGQTPARRRPEEGFGRGSLCQRAGQDRSQIFNTDSAS